MLLCEDFLSKLKMASCRCWCAATCCTHCWENLGTWFPQKYELPASEEFKILPKVLCVCVLASSFHYPFYRCLDGCNYRHLQPLFNVVNHYPCLYQSNRFLDHLQGHICLITTIIIVIKPGSQATIDPLSATLTQLASW